MCSVGSMGRGDTTRFSRTGSSCDLPAAAANVPSCIAIAFYIHRIQLLHAIHAVCCVRKTGIIYVCEPIALRVIRGSGLFFITVY